MKYMILSYASQQDYDAMAGKPGREGAPSAEDFQPMYEFMAKFNADLVESGELVETRALAAPVHTRRIGGTSADGTVVTDGPYAETQEVLAGYWVVECESFDRATQIAAKLGECPAPGDIAQVAYADVRPIIESADDLAG